MSNMLEIDPNNPVHHRALQALLHMRHDKNYQDVVIFLQDGLDKLRRQGDIETGDVLKWNQGWRQCLQFVLDLPETAETIVKKKKEQDAATAAQANQHQPHYAVPGKYPSYGPLTPNFKDNS